MRRQIVPLILTPAELNLVNQLNAIGATSWDASPLTTQTGQDITIPRDDLKEKIKSYLYNHQEEHCAYCTTDLSGTTWEIDHVAKKSIFGQLTWHLSNLVCACTACNIRRKGNRNMFVNNSGLAPATINTSNQLNYTIVHPILIDPHQHFSWCVELIFCNNATPLGKTTDDHFEITSPTMTFNRIANQARQTTPTTAHQQLISEIMSVVRTKR